MKPNDLTVIVGLNDIGKSNLLKALNLFFNSETEPQKKLDFNEDYCRYTPAKRKKAREITIELIIEPPANYAGAEPIRWTKVWRKDGLHDDDLRFISGQQFPKRSKVSSWIRNIKYKYVPAVKGEGYFQNLLGDLHDTLATTISETMENAGVDFIGKIRENTENITLNINKRLGLKSDIHLPTNLRELFKTLDFKTVRGNFEVSLKQRGDGIKTRHIPVILHFLSEQENRNRQKGSPKVNTVWGYEEPENNLEMGKAFDLAREFLDYSKEVQVLLTTHSPAFYSLTNSSEGVAGYFAQSGEENSTIYTLIDPNVNASLNEHMGVLAVITPHIQDEIKKNSELRKKITEQQKEIDKKKTNTLYVEGKTDDLILNSYFKAEIANDRFKIETEPEGAGVVYVHDMIVAWSFSKNPVRAIALFDKDEAGKTYRMLATNTPKVQDAMAKKRVKIMEVPLPAHILKLYKEDIFVPVSIEELFPPFIWAHAEKQGWLEDRVDVKSFIHKTIPHDSSLKAFLSDLGLSTDELRYIFKNVRDASKDPFSKYVASLDGNEFETAFAEFEKLKNDILKFF